MKIGAIDIGTNSVRLLVAEPGEKKLNRLVERMEVPRLGEDINQTGYLKEKAIERTIKVLAEYKKVIEEFAAIPKVVATSAVREADNQAEFVTRVKKEVGLELNPISGRQEAYLSYLGVVSELISLTGRNLVVDIGGGSTELIKGEAQDLLAYDSIEVGAVRLKEEVEDNVEQLKKRINRRVSFSAKNFNQLVGVGGTITSLAAIKQELEVYDRTKVHGLELSKVEINQILNHLIDLPLPVRQKVPGLSQRRADIIVPGIVILLQIMNETGLEKITVSDASILEGIVYENI